MVVVICTRGSCSICVVVFVHYGRAREHDCLARVGSAWQPHVSLAHTLRLLIAAEFSLMDTNDCIRVF